MSYQVRPTRKPIRVRVSNGSRSIIREVLDFGGFIGFLVLLVAALGYAGGLDRRLEHLETNAVMEEPYMAPDAPVWPTVPTDNVQGAPAPVLEEI